MVAVPPRMRASLTGRARARSGLFGRIVLQVEELQEAIKREYPPPPSYDEEQCREWRSRPPEVLWAKRVWRDATWEDLQALPGFRIGPVAQPDDLRAILNELTSIREETVAMREGLAAMRRWDEMGMPATRDGPK